MQHITNNFFIYKITGDGHCFINCILKATKNLDYLNLDQEYYGQDLWYQRKLFVRKFRCDIANYLLAESNIPVGLIHARLAILNPEVMSIIFIQKDPRDLSDYVLLKNICENFNGENFDEIYEAISLYFNLKNGTEISVDEVKEIYEEDFRNHCAYKDAADLGKDVSPVKFGVDKFSPTMNYYTLCENVISTNLDETNGYGIEDIINNLIDDDSYIEYPTSVIISKLLNLKIYPFSIEGFLDIQPLYELPLETKTIFLYNHSNNHWDLIGLKKSDTDNTLSFLFSHVNKEKTILPILHNIKNMFDTTF